MEDAAVAGYEGKRIAVVGAGVVGVTTAVRAQRRLAGAAVTLLSEQVTPHTTGDGSAGLWEPYLLADTPPALVQRWAVETYRHLLSLWRRPEAPELGVSLVPLVCVGQQPPGPPPAWAPHVLGFTSLDHRQLDALSAEHGRRYTSGFSMVTLTAEPTRWLPSLLEEFRSRGGKLVHPYTVRDLTHLEREFDAVVNCAGLGAAKFVKDDDDPVFPIRGQVARVYAPWIKHVFLEEFSGGNYVIPNIDSVVLGGTSQHRDWECDVRPEDSEHVLGGCARLLPALRSAPLLVQWAGLRPARRRVRLEAQRLPGSALKVVHNYGHGGAGITLSWGCAGHAVDLLQQELTACKL
ncbi:D-aspartate oxidase [Schistocerca cancellata]|uniref:D-aspartate oxidase n=1 Tax=Schistocerca cancellata TaxID=274614 RepID=UPI002119A013|nr:D-aspartate oxidase [Schistocerca cancellata]